MKLTNAQTKTLRTIAANGGEMNGWAGQKGFYCLSLAPLVRMGLLEDIGTCDCYRHEACNIEHTTLEGQREGHLAYGRVKLTEAARGWLTEN